MGSTQAQDHLGHWKTSANGVLSKDANGDEKTDYSRWRLLDDDGRQTWHYLESDEENEKWPQSFADKYFLGLPTVNALFSIMYS
jgi:lanosterol synthase